MENLQTFSYNDQTIEFDLINQDVMVNATEMALPFGKSPKDFLKTEPTKAYIKLACQDEYFRILYPFQGWNSTLETNVQEDLNPLETRKRMIVNTIYGGRKNGTWMHRQLALKFAAWLSPEFEFWVWKTIDEILYGHFKKVQEIENQNRIKQQQLEELRRKLLLENEDYNRLLTLELEIKHSSSLRKKHSLKQMELFREMIKPDAQ
jgi:hypothetical protein